MTGRHYHGYAVSQLRARSLWTQQCANPFCRAIVLSGYGRSAVLVVLVAIATLLLKVVV